MLQPVDTVRIFQKNGQPQSFSAGQIVFAAGELGQMMYGIVEGEVDLFVNGKLVETLKKGDVFGVGALIQDDHARDSTAIAKTDCQVLSLDRERFLFAVQETPLFALEIMKSYSDRLRNLKHLL